MRFLQAYIISEGYFLDARKWYQCKYTNPLFQKSWLFFATSMMFLIFIVVGISVYIMLPIKTQVNLAVSTESSIKQKVTLNKVINYDNQAHSLAHIMLTNYITTRESYDYQDLKRQFTFIQNNSSNLVFKEFYDNMNIDNPLSPIMIYQKHTIVKTNIIEIKYNKFNQAQILFHAEAYDQSQSLIEKKLLTADVVYIIDSVDASKANESRFSFMITDYTINLIKEYDITQKH